MNFNEAVTVFFSYLNRVETSDSGREFHPFSYSGPGKYFFQKIIIELKNNPTSERKIELIKDMFHLLDTKKIQFNCCRCMWIDEIGETMKIMKETIGS